MVSKKGLREGFAVLVKICITLKKSVRDPQGAAVLSSLNAVGYENVKNVRFGKYLELEVDEEDREKVDAQVKEMCNRLLVNPVVEDFSYELK